MKNTDCSRSAFPAPCPIRPGWCSRRPWPASRRPSRATGRDFRKTSSVTACCPTPSSKPSSMPAKPMASFSPALDGRRDLRCRQSRPRRRRGRGALSAWLHARRRHGRRQGPPVGRHHSRQLAAGPPQGAVDQQIRQADRGRAARLVGARHGAPAGHAAVALPARQQRSRWRKASCSRPTPRYAPTIVARRFRASSRSSNGWAPISTA